MRAFGGIAIVIAVLLLFIGMAMDTSVPSGIGRVNNIGLIAAQQRYLMLGGLLLITGLLMSIFGGRKGLTSESSPQARDERPCPFCAEPIKKAAIKCKHCGSDVEQEAAPAPTSGWVVSVSCKPGEDLLSTLSKLKELDLPVMRGDTSVVSVGPYEQKKDADAVRRRLTAVHYIHGDLAWIPPT